MPPAPEAAPARDNETSLARGATIGRYIVLEMVGRGGMGEVYAAYDPELDRKIAIKLLRARPGQGSLGSDGRARLMREAQAIAKLSHPNVIVVYDVGTFQDRVFIAMEFVEGHTVTYWMHAQPRHWSEILRVFIAAGRGLAAAHEKEMVHRDFKPDNVMVRNDGQIRVMDFGLARLADREKTTWVAAVPPTPDSLKALVVAAGDPSDSDEKDLQSTRVVNDKTPTLKPESLPSTTLPLGLHLTRTGSMLGTPAYMAPEQFLGRPTDARTDQFSFCVALYEALFDQRPFAGDTLFGLTANVVQGVVTPPPAQTPVPTWLRKALMKGLSVSPDDRWPSMETLLAELGRNRTVPERKRFASTALSKLAGIWEPPMRGRRVETAGKEQMRQAFLATGKLYAANAFEGASKILDQYAKSWAEMYADTCEATHVRQEQSAEVLDLRIAFLQEALESLKALCVVFREANGEVVENALNAANALPRVERCADVEVLRAVLKPPADPAARAAVDSVRTRLAQLRTLVNVGRVADAHRAVGALEPEARRLGYGPLLAEVLTLLGNIQIQRVEPESAARALEEAVWTAELSRHDEVVAEAATQLVGVGSYALNRDVVEIWARHAEMTLRRMGGHEQLLSWLMNNRAGVRHKYGDLKGAMDDIRQAIAAKEKVFGPDHSDTAISIGNLALYLADDGDLEGAIVHAERSLRILESREGPEHPRSALISYNYSEYLNQAGRHAEARVAAKQALATFERETDPHGLVVTMSLLALGIAHLGEGMADQALPIIERAVRNLEQGDQDPARLGEAHFALARALTANARDLTRARELAERARKEFAQAPSTVPNTRALERLDAFLSGG